MADQNDTLKESFQTSIKKNINLRIKVVKKKLLKKGITFDKGILAADIGMSPGALSHFLGEHGTRKLTVWEFYRICVILKTQPQVLAPIILALTEDEKQDPAIRESLNLDHQVLSKTEEHLLLLFRGLSKNQQQCFMSMAVNFQKALDLKI